MDVLSRVLARAFHHDPFHRWIFATEAACKRNSHRSFVVAMRGQLPYGTVFTTDRLEGAALWAAP